MSLSDVLRELHASYSAAAIVGVILLYILARGLLHALDTALRVVGFVGAQIRRDAAELRSTWHDTRAILKGKPPRCSPDTTPVVKGADTSGHTKAERNQSSEPEHT